MFEDFLLMERFALLSKIIMHSKQVNSFAALEQLFGW